MSDGPLSEDLTMYAMAAKGDVLSEDSGDDLLEFGRRAAALEAEVQELRDACERIQCWYDAAMTVAEEAPDADSE